MKAYQCENCGAKVKEEKKPNECPLCKHGKSFSKIELPDPTPEDLKYTKKYEKVIDKMEEYLEGTEQIEGFSQFPDD